jgi:hypothetical protein
MSHPRLSVDDILTPARMRRGASGADGNERSRKERLVFDVVGQMPEK